jgi:hypothetical protein
MFKKAAEQKVRPSEQPAGMVEANCLDVHDATQSNLTPLSMRLFRFRY